MLIFWARAENFGDFLGHFAEVTLLQAGCNFLRQVVCTKMTLRSLLSAGSAQTPSMSEFSEYWYARRRKLAVVATNAHMRIMSFSAGLLRKVVSRPDRLSPDQVRQDQVRPI